MVALGSLLLGAASADVLATRDGRQLEGTLRGATSDTLRFESDGSLHSIAIADVASLHFDAAPRAATPAAETPVRPPVKLTTFEVPPGTRLRVRIADTIDPRIGVAGDRFSARLESPLVAGERVIVAAGTRLYGVVGEARTTGPVASRLKLELTQLAIDETLVPVVTGNHQVVVGDAEASAGPARAGEAPRPDRIPAGSLLEFRLLQSAVVTVPPAR
jgi:hypothetical protein